MVINAKMTADEAYGKDVKTMTYDELMESLNFLDHEREEIKKDVSRSIRRKGQADKDKKKRA